MEMPVGECHDKRRIDTCNSLLKKDHHIGFSGSQYQPIVIAVTEVLKTHTRILNWKGPASC